MDSRLHRRARAALATGLAAAIFIGGVLAAPAGAAAASPQLPFWAAFSGSAAFTGPSTSAFLGSGYAGLMGRISTDGDAAVTGVVDSPCAGGLANTNIETLTSANGDRLTITSSDVACPIGPGRYHGTGRWVVFGGTGRFAGATGHGLLDGVSDFAAGTFSVALLGAIVLDR